jgi:hypothetical protein
LQRKTPPTTIEDYSYKKPIFSLQQDCKYNNALSPCEVDTLKNPKNLKQDTSIQSVFFNINIELQPQTNDFQENKHALHKKQDK